jgi:hypothetical protein
LSAGDMTRARTVTPLNQTGGFNASSTDPRLGAVVGVGWETTQLASLRPRYTDFASENASALSAK